MRTQPGNAVTVTGTSYRPLVVGIRTLPVNITPEYLAALRAGVEAAGGVTAFAKQTGISRQNVWRALNEGGDRDRPTFEVLEKIRTALASVGTHLPPFVVAVRDTLDHQWIEAGRELRRRDPARFEKMLRTISTKERGRR